MEIFGKFCFTIILITVSMLIGGFVMMKLYGWILVPIYGINPITVGQAIGLATFIGYTQLGITMNMKSDIDEDKSFIVIFITKLITNIFMYGLILLIGWIVSFIV